MKGSEAFERTLRDTMESFEMPYNSADWTQLERELDKGNGSRWKSSLGLLALLCGGAIALATTVYFTVYNGTGTETAGEAALLARPATTEPAPAMVLVNDAAGTNSTTSNEARSMQPQYASAGVPSTTSEVRSSVPKPPSPGNNPEPANALLATVATPVTTPANTEVAIRPSVTEGCPGSVVEFAAENLPSTGTFLWNFGDGSFSRDPKPQHVFSKAGRFEVMLSHSSVGGGTIHNKPVSDEIIIHEIPEATFNFLKQEYDNTVPSVHFENRSMGGHTYLWEFGDGGSSAIAHPSHVYKKKGTYTVALTVTNTRGCTDRMEKTVHIDADYNLLADMTFSPNGDGVDDNFIPEALRTLGVKFHMTVHDPVTGQLLFETSDAQRPWNGRIAGKGEPCLTGDYVWMVEMKDGDKLGGTYNGTVSLVR